MTKQIRWGIVCLLVLLAMLCGCGHDQATHEKSGKTFVLGDTTFNAENNEADINPHHECGGWACIRYGVGETLFRYNDNMELEPWLAQRAVQLDPLTWKITLRDHITFTSNRPMDSGAVKECLEHLIAVHKRAANDLHIADIGVSGQDVIIHTTVPVSALLHYLADPYSCIIDMKDGISPQGMVTGTGPYMPVSLVSGKELELVKNETYWQGMPKLDRVIVRTITDGDTLTMALQSGEIDAAYGLPYASYALFDNDAYTISSTPTSRTFFASMNFASPVMQDPAVRKAVSMAIDKDGFVKTLLLGHGYPAAGPFPDTMACGDRTVQSEPYHLEEAKQVLEQDGWIDSDGDGIREKNGQKLRIRWLTYPSRQELPLLAEAAQASLKQIGIDVEINNTANHNVLRQDKTAWDIYASAMVTAPTGDPAYFFSYSCLDRSDANIGGYHNEALEQLAQQMAQTADAKQRSDLAIQMSQLILNDHAYVFCSHLQMSLIAKANVTGLQAHPCDFYEITADLDKQ